MVTAIIANSKAYSGIAWFFIGLVLGIFGLILIACLPSHKNDVTPAGYSPKDETKRCPECAEEILKAAKVCKHCGHRLA
ncbi:MAG: zinc ribbon domain-containing protein [Salipiger marinus]|uniref:zinc ribbon domain-containing protein n=1 Tax=Salipiger marinus TaxID=555512 RepID=UPI0040593688